MTGETTTTVIGSGDGWLAELTVVGARLKEATGANYTFYSQGLVDVKLAVDLDAGYVLNYGAPVCSLNWALVSEGSVAGPPYYAYTVRGDMLKTSNVGETNYQGFTATCTASGSVVQPANPSSQPQIINIVAVVKVLPLMTLSIGGSPPYFVAATVKGSPFAPAAGIPVNFSSGNGVVFPVGDGTTDDQGTALAIVLADISGGPSVSRQAETPIEVKISQDNFPVQTQTFTRTFATIGDFVGIVSVKGPLGGGYTRAKVGDILPPGTFVQFAPAIGTGGSVGFLKIQFGEGSTASVRTYNEAVVLEIGPEGIISEAGTPLFVLSRQTALDIYNNPKPYATWVVENVIINYATAGAGRALKLGSWGVEALGTAVDWTWGKAKSLWGSQVGLRTVSAGDFAASGDIARVYATMDQNGNTVVANTGSPSQFTAASGSGGEVSIRTGEQLYVPRPDSGPPGPPTFFRSDDTSPPLLEIVPADGSILASRLPTVTLRFIETGSGIDIRTASLRINGSLIVAGSRQFADPYTSSGPAGLVWQIPLAQPLRDGTNDIAVSVADIAGNVGIIAATYVVTAAPAPVMSLRGVAGAGRALLWWDAPPGGASTYAIERAPAISGAYIRVTGGLTTTTYLDSGLSAGIAAYRVIAQSGAESAPSNTVSFKILPPIGPTVGQVVIDPPTGLSAEAKEDSIILRWQPVSGTVAYSVFRATSQAGPYVRLNAGVPIARTSFTDTAISTGTTYWYEVSAYDALLREGAVSAPVSATPTDLPPPTPKGTSAYAVGTNILVEWNPVVAKDLAGFHVYLTPPSGTPVRLTPAPLPATRFVATVKPGEGGLFTVRAVDASGKESAPSIGAVAFSGAGANGVNLHVPAGLATRTID